MIDYLLPNGRPTRVRITYEKAWSRLGREVAREIGRTMRSKCRLIGYDPGVSIKIERDTIIVPTEAALTIQRLAKKR